MAVGSTVDIDDSVYVVVVDGNSVVSAVLLEVIVFCSKSDYHNL